MSTNLLSDFIVDKNNRTVTIKRDFDALLNLVWDAWTKPELLDQWWAPKPFTSKTKEMDFVVGGRRFYAMVSPDGYERWAIQRYTSIDPKTNFSFYSVFADKDENPDPVGSDWKIAFHEHHGNTTVTITIYNESLERMEKMIEMGFNQGFTTTLNELKELLKTLK